jgi:cell division septum initiation protein DivIVA
MKTLHDEAFYEGIYQPDEVRYALNKVKHVIEELQKEIEKLKLQIKPSPHS